MKSPTFFFSQPLSPQRYRACVTDPKALAALDARVRAGALADHVTATPTFFVNGRKVGEGEVSLEALAAAIAEVEVEVEVWSARGIR